MKLKTLLLSATFALASANAAQAATYVYVGSWHVGQGPVWTSNPAVYTGQQAAALLFGGTAAQYAISTIDSNVANINFSSFVDGYGDSQFLTTAVSHSFSLQTGTGYDGPPSYSAYVLDHSCGIRYSNPEASCDGQPGLNFAFRLVSGAVPEPASWALMMVGFGAVGSVMRRRVAVAA
nr:PEPxxWA-CTERM sorting domain-containing protein [Sandarakinorhabdus sp.]